MGDVLTLTLLRDGAELAVSYALRLKLPLVPVLHGVDASPSFLIVGGLVFAPLSMPLLESACGARKWRSIVPLSVLAAMHRPRLHPRQQLVVLLQVLSHQINSGCAAPRGAAAHAARRALPNPPSRTPAPSLSFRRPLFLPTSER